MQKDLQVRQGTLEPHLDLQEFRSALGSFATGVTIVTTKHEGIDVGLTANSFNSVSLEPPMVLWSLGKTSRSLASFTGSSHFAVHILAEHQEALSAQFAKRGADKFAGLELQRGQAHLPLLTGCAARFQCRKLFEYEGGDHIIFVGEVVEFDHTVQRPLLFHGGRYAVAAHRQADAASNPDRDLAPDGLSFLLTQAFFSLRAPGLRYAEKMGVGWADRYLLGALLDGAGRTLEAVNELIGYSGLTATRDAVQRLVEKDFITVSVSSEHPETLLIAEAGREYCLSMIAATRACEAEVEMHLGDQVGQLKELLKRVLRATAGGDDGRVSRHMKQMSRNLDLFGEFGKASSS